MTDTAADRARLRGDLPGAARPRGDGLLLAGLGLLLAALFLVSLLVGPAPVPPGQILAGLAGRGDPAVVLVAQEVRLPRALLGALVGAGLGMAGAALQGFLRNPLADPGLVGASASASFGAVLVLYFGLSAQLALAMPLAGMAGAGCGMALILMLAGRQASVLSLILAGVAVQTLAGALTSLALNLAPNPHAALEIAFWLLGSLTDRTRDHVLLAAPFLLVGMAMLARERHSLDALGLGERTAASLGVDVAALRRRIVLGTVLAVGPGVAVTGAIGFIGLVVPHLLRPFVGHEPGRLLLPSALAGGALLLAADILVRLVPTNDELKLGVVTGLIGAPFFLLLLNRLRAEVR